MYTFMYGQIVFDISCIYLIRNILCVIVILISYDTNMNLYHSIARFAEHINYVIRETPLRSHGCRATDDACVPCDV